MRLFALKVIHQDREMRKLNRISVFFFLLLYPFIITVNMKYIYLSTEY